MMITSQYRTNTETAKRDLQPQQQPALTLGFLILQDHACNKSLRERFVT